MTALSYAGSETPLPATKPEPLEQSLGLFDRRLYEQPIELPQLKQR